MIREPVSNSKLRQEHVIKLQDKRVKVSLQYSSPPKNQSKSKLRSIHRHHQQPSSHEFIKIRKVKHLNAPLFITKYTQHKQSPLFYQNKMQPCSMLNEYQRFHTKLLKNETQTPKIKVYSNSKELKMQKDSKVNVSRQIRNSNTEVPVRKIKLYSPKKGKQNTANVPKSGGVVRLHQQKPMKGTPQRRYKIEVTSSSRSRKKFDSMLSNRQNSFSAINQQPFQRSALKKPNEGQQSAGVNMKSLNSFCLQK